MDKRDESTAKESVPAPGSFVAAAAETLWDNGRTVWRDAGTGAVETWDARTD